MSGGKVSNHCSGDSSFTFDAHMSGHATVDASGAHTGSNTCGQKGSATGGSGSLGITALQQLSGNIMINPHMYDGSSFTGGPMVTGAQNHFSLQQLPWSAGGDVGFNAGVVHGDVHGDYESKGYHLQQLPWSAGGDVGFNTGVVHGDVHGDYESKGYHLVNLDSGNIMINPNMQGSSSFTGGVMTTGDGNHFRLLM